MPRWVDVSRLEFEERMAQHPFFLSHTESLRFCVEGVVQDERRKRKLNLQVLAFSFSHATWLSNNLTSPTLPKIGNYGYERTPRAK